ncbi:hypothetical protein [Parafrankia sp. FMc2]
MTRRFNTAGPCRPGIDYMIPAASRLPEAQGLIDAEPPADVSRAPEAPA